MPGYFCANVRYGFVVNFCCCFFCSRCFVTGGLLLFHGAVVVVVLLDSLAGCFLGYLASSSEVDAGVTYTSLLGSKSESISPTIFEGSFLYENGAFLVYFESPDLRDKSRVLTLGDSTDSMVIMLLSGVESSSGCPSGGRSSLPLLSSSLILSVKYEGANLLA